MRTRQVRAALLVGPLLPVALAPACSLFVDLGSLSKGDGGAGGAGGGTGGPAGGTVSTSTGTGGGGLFWEDDELTGEFGEGTFEGTEWTGDGTLALENTGAGTFTSRVFDAGSPAIWQTLGWSALGPYGKALPDGGVKEDYVNGSADMTANVLLLHLDGTSMIFPGDKLPDSSGLGYVATVSKHEVSFTGGRFDRALDDGPEGHVYVDTGTAPQLSFGDADFTWSLWVKGTEACSGNKVYLGLDDGPADTPHLWLGCTVSGGATCPSGAAGGRAAGVFKANQETGETQVLCGSTSITDGSWHHLAIVKKGHPAVTVALYVDGGVEAVARSTWAAGIVYSTNPELAVGAFSEGTYPAKGAFDEVAVWRRALSATEIADLHRRGALELSFQVRGCTSADCSDDPPFVGPGADPTQRYLAAGPTTWSLVDIDAVSPGGSKTARYFQYRAYFGSTALPAVPELWTVEIGAQHE